VRVRDYGDYRKDGNMAREGGSSMTEQVRAEIESLQERLEVLNRKQNDELQEAGKEFRSLVRMKFKAQQDCGLVTSRVVVFMGEPVEHFLLVQGMWTDRTIERWVALVANYGSAFGEACDRQQGGTYAVVDRAASIRAYFRRRYLPQFDLSDGVIRCGWGWCNAFENRSESLEKWKGMVVSLARRRKLIAFINTSGFLKNEVLIWEEEE